MYHVVQSLLLISFSVVSCVAQHKNAREIEAVVDSIIIQKQGTKETYHLGLAVLSRPELKELLSKYPEALTKFRGGQAWNAVGAVTCVGGGFLFGYSIGQAIGNSVNSTVTVGKDGMKRTMDWRIFGAGIGSLGAGVLMLIYGKHLRVKAIETYNSKLRESGDSSRLILLPAPTGIGLAMRF